MRVVLAIIGALAGLALGLLLLGNAAGTWLTENQAMQSPDDVATSHALGFLITSFLCLVIGWFVGWGIGGLFGRGGKS